MDFLEEIASRPELEAALAEAGDYEDLRRIGEAQGSVFTVGELDLVFRHRCAMRWLRCFPTGIADQSTTAPARSRPDPALESQPAAV